MKRKNIDWLKRIEQLIAENTTPPRTRGKYKGHGSTDSLAWVGTLAKEVQRDIKRRHGRGIGYDENMAIAFNLGFVLLQWYFLVHRAKSYDENRPLAIRRKVLKRINARMGLLVAAITDDRAMGKNWPGQSFRLPYGKAAKGGRFV